MSEGVVTPLQYPIDGGEALGKITTVTLRRPTAGDLESMDAAEGNVGKTILLIAALSDLPMAVCRRLDGEDFTALDGVCTRYLKGKK